MPAFSIPRKPVFSGLPSAHNIYKNQTLFSDKTFTACEIPKLSDGIF